MLSENRRVIQFRKGIEHLATTQLKQHAFNAFRIAAKLAQILTAITVAGH